MGKMSTTTYVYSNTYSPKILAVNGNNIYANTWYGLFQSTNNGDSWESLIFDSTGIDVMSIAFNGNNIFIIDNNGIFLSTDIGNSWQKFNQGLDSMWLYEISISENNIYVITERGLYLSTNNGANWNNISKNLVDFYGNILNINLIAFNKNNIYVSTIFGLFLSTNNGVVWNGLVYDGGDFNSLAIKGDSIYLVIYDWSLELSTDNGDNWFLSYGDLRRFKIQIIYINSNNIFMGTGGQGILYSINDGPLLKYSNKGLTDSTINAIVTNNDYIFILTPDGIFRAKLSNFGITYVNDVALKQKYSLSLILS